MRIGGVYNEMRIGGILREQEGGEEAGLKFDTVIFTDRNVFRILDQRREKSAISLFALSFGLPWLRFTK